MEQIMKNTKKNTLMTKKELVKHLKNLTTEYVENVKMAMIGYKYYDSENNNDIIISDLVGNLSTKLISEGLTKIK